MGYLFLIFTLATVLAVIGIRQHRNTLVVLSGCTFISLGVVTLAGGLFGAALSCSSNPLGYGFGSGEECGTVFMDEILTNPAVAVVLVAAILQIPLGIGLLAYAHRRTFRSANPRQSPNSQDSTDP